MKPTLNHLFLTGLMTFRVILAGRCSETNVLNPALKASACRGAILLLTMALSGCAHVDPTRTLLSSGFDVYDVKRVLGTNYLGEFDGLRAAVSERGEVLIYDSKGELRDRMTLDQFNDEHLK